MPPERRLHVALLTDGVMPFVLGGIQRHSRKLCEQLLRLGIDVTLYHTAPAGHPAARAARLEGWDPDLRWRLRTEFVDWPRGTWYPGHYVGDCRRYSSGLLARFLQRQAFDPVDFVYAQGLTGLAFVGGRRRGLPIPPVGINAHGYEMFQPCMGVAAKLGQVLMRPPHRRVSLGADLVFSFSGGIRDIVERKIGVPGSRIRVIPNAVDATWISSDARPPRSPRKFVFVGRHERRKGVPELLEALRRLDGCDWAMDFIGPIPEDQRLSDPRVRYLGVVSEESALIRLYDDCDAIVAPSFAEGMPTVLIEAMARGLVPIATDVGAVREPVEAACGIILASQAPECIRSAMHSLALMPDGELLRRKSSALEAARAFTWDLVARRVVEAIEEALGRRRNIRAGSPAAEP